VTSPDRPPTVRPVEYKGEPLDAERGPGLGCFWFQVGLLGVLVVLTPLTVVWNWPWQVSGVLLLLTCLLLLFAGQTVIFLLRLVAADRRDGRRRPLSSGTPTVGELEDTVGGAPEDGVSLPTDAATAPDAAPGGAGMSGDAGGADMSGDAGGTTRTVDPGMRE
jgi:hypothetical protein